MNTKENADIGKAFNRLHLKTQTQRKCEAFHVVYASQEMSLCMLPERHQYFEGCSLFHILSWLSLWFHSIVREVTEALHPFQ